MSTLKNYLFVVPLLSSVFSFAQIPETKRTDHWYFGDHAGIDFSSGSPVVDNNSAMNAWEGCSSVSDTSGNLLFYTNGDTVWNKNHQIMPTGTGLLGCLSSTQAALIVPKPLSNNIYYIFTTDCDEDTCQRGTRYSIVDMNLAGGLGDVTTKNILLLAPSTEHLAGVKASNCIDVWVMSHDLTGNSFYAYLVTPAGVNTSPVITTIGDPNFPGFNGFWWGTIGEFKFSPDAKKIVSIRFFDALANSSLYKSLELFDFNNSTGILSNYQGLATDSSLYGGTFSPDNSKLYVTRENNIYQYDLLAGSTLNIISSKTLINSPSVFYFGAMQITPNQKIFIANFNGNTLWSDSLSLIDSPDSPAGLCNFMDNGFYLNGMLTANSGLPNFIESYFDSVTCLTAINENNNSANYLIVYPNPFNSSTLVVIPNIQSIENLTINIYDALGRKQETGNISPVEFNNNNAEIKINKGNLSSGMYFLKIENNNHSYSQKLMITNN